MTQTTAQLRKLLDGPGMLLAPFVYDGMQAKIAERTGFEAVYMTGFGTAAARGYPDLGLLTMTEMVQNVRAVSHAVSLPVICDADTGYGNPVNVWRTVREYEEAGAAALHIEDQVWPKNAAFCRASKSSRLRSDSLIGRGKYESKSDDRKPAMTETAMATKHVALSP